MIQLKNYLLAVGYADGGFLYTYLKDNFNNFFCKNKYNLSLRAYSRNVKLKNFFFIVIWVIIH